MHGMRVDASRSPDAVDPVLPGRHGGCIEPGAEDRDMQDATTFPITQGDLREVRETLSRLLGGSVPPGAVEVGKTPVGLGRLEPERVLATVLFTDIVGSTERVAELGDGRWRALLEQFHARVRREVTRERGRVVNTAGDGLLATFDAPTRAIRCARAIGRVVGALGIEVKIGLHAGECEVLGDEVVGIAVHIGARVSSKARPGEVLVSSTVKDLVAGSGIRFADRGAHVLKGVPEAWRLFAALPCA
jgi:class 3 adenylate cyclase